MSVRPSAVAMATIQRSPPLEIRHEPQQSHDSGAYIDWNSESGSPTRKNSGSEVEVSVPGKVASEEFVTVVSVEGDGTTGAVVVVADDGATKKNTKLAGEGTISHVEVPFVTVLSVGGDAPVASGEKAEGNTTVSLDISGNESSMEGSDMQVKETEKNIMTGYLTDSEEVLVYRLPGERLGFGLKFEGGTKTAERVRRLFIQSCAAESPASRARCSWGGLGEGDEVLEIDTVPVSLMTRLDCVRRLKESRVVITLRVRPAPGKVIPIVIEADTPSEPPPVPPRKGQRRASAPKVEEAPPPPVGFGDDGVSTGQRRRASEGDAIAVALSMRQRIPLSPGPIGRNRLSPEHPVPPEAETYIDLLAQEEYAARNAESESDDTGSTISTVVDRLSLNSVSALSSASSENRSPEHGPYGSAIDLARVLDPFERLEREFSSSDSEFTQTRHTITSITSETRVFNGDVSGKREKEISPAALAINVHAATALEDDLALQPPPNFQDIPLDDGDGQSIRSSQSSESTEHETSTEERQDAPRLPPKPAPRKEGHRFRSGKKRPPPPPPPTRVDRPLWQSPEENEDAVAGKLESVVDAIIEKDILPMEEIDLSPERVEEEIEKVAEMLRKEGREGRMFEEMLEETNNVSIVGGIEKDVNSKTVEELLKATELDAVDKELAEEVVIRDIDVMDGVLEVVVGSKISDDDNDVKVGEDEDEEEAEEEEEVEEDDEDDDLMIDSRLSEELWQSGPTDVLFPHFHWSVTQLATIGEDEEEQTDSDNRSTPERLSMEGDVESLSDEEGKEGVPGPEEEKQKTTEVEEEVGESGAEELRVVAEGEVGEAEGSAGEAAPLAPQHSRQNHLRDRPEGNGEEVFEVGVQLPDVRIEEVSGEVAMPLEAMSAGEERVEGAEDTASNPGDDQEAQLIKDPCADITAALGPALSPVSCETAPTSATDGEAVSLRAPIKGSSAKTEEVSLSDGPLCSTPSETHQQQLNGSSSSILLEQSPVAADDYEKGATSLQEDLQVTSPSNDTGLGNMDSLLSMQSSSDISNGLSHSLDDSSLPPSFSRLPPDGHEFPPNYQEPLRIASNSMTSDPSLNKSSETTSITDMPPDTPPPPLPTSCPPQKDLSEAAPASAKSLPPPPPARKPPQKDSFNNRLPPRPSGERRHWMKDEKSEKSVRDKIAMFQRETPEDAPLSVTSAPPVPATRSPFKFDTSEDSQKIRKGMSAPQWGEDARGRSHLSRSMINVDGTGRGGDHATPTLYPPSSLYKGGVHNSTGDVSAGMEGVDGSRTLDFVRTRSNLDLTSSSASCSPDSSLSSASSYSGGGVYATLPRKPVATQRPPIAAERTTSVLEHRPPSPDSSSWNTPTFSPSNRSGNLHSRSQSLIDVGSPKRHSISGNYNYKYGNNGADDAKKSSLNAMIEQRRRNVSKLRGLVIPEKMEVARCDQSLFDLPEIKSRDAIIISGNCKTATLPRCDSKQLNRWSENMNGHSAKSQNASNNFANTNGVTLTSPPWKSQAPLPDLPKYSPAFKRRTLSVHGLSNTSFDSSREELRSQDQSKLHPPTKPPRTSNGYGIGPSSPLGPEPKSLESITSPRSDSSFDFSPICHIDSSKEEEVVPVIKSNGGTGSYGDGHNGKSAHRGLLHVPSRGASAEDSDNDSAVSSSRSSISHGFSPPSSPLPGDTSDGGMRPSAPRQHISRDRMQSEERSRISTSQRRSAGNIVDRATSPEKRPLRRTLSSETTASVSSAASTASTVTSGSQDGGNGSDSSSNRRVLKAQSVEAINRKNVLASAKYSSGRDLKVGSPLIKRKFEEDGSGTEADVEDTAKAENPSSPLSRPNGTERLAMHYKTTRELNGIHDVEASRNMDIKVAYVDEIIEYPFVNGSVDCSEVPVPAQRRIYTSPRPTSPISEYSTTESVCGSHKEDKKVEVKGMDDRESVTEEVCTSKTSPSVPIDRWMELEKKYAPKISPIEARASIEAQESPYKGHILEDEIDYLSRKVGGDSEKSRAKSYAEKQKDTGNGFRAIAEKWQIISNDASTLPSPTNPVAAVTTSSATPNREGRKNSRRSSTNGADAARVSPETARPKAEEPLRIPPPPESAPPPVPHSNGEATHSEAVRLREKKAPIARPTSFNGCGEKTLSVASTYTTQETRTTMSREESTPEARAPPAVAAAPVTAAQRASNRRSVSVNDIRKAFEKVELTVSPNGKASTVTRTKGNAVTTVHTRVSSLDSTTSEDSSMPTPAHYGSVNNLASNHRDQFGSITSLASSTSLISQQELQQLIEEANQSLDEASLGGGAPLVHEVEVVVLHREMAGGSVGITLAGGADYEAKEITVHKVLAGSPAERDGRLQRGDRILSINGKSMKGATHREAISILKAPRSEVVLVVSRSRLENSQLHPSQQHLLQQGANGGSDVSLPTLSAPSIRTLGSSSRPPRIVEQPAEGSGGENSDDAEKKKEDDSRGPPETLTLTKDGAGLGFSLEGGKDSPSGDKPLTIKKIFTGGAAEKHGGLHVGDELLVVNGIDVTPLSRIEAWGIMKKLPDGLVLLTIRRKI